MITSVDTNILAALWDPEDSLSLRARAGLDHALKDGGLILSAPVYAELVAEPGRDERVIERFLHDTGIRVDWIIDEPIWLEAGRAYKKYVFARRKQSQGAPRRILADFVIGAHAAVRRYRLLTLDSRIYRSSFPSLDVIAL